MRFFKVTGNKREYTDLLLMGDEQESMIDKYIDACELYALEVHGGVKGICAVVCRGATVEIKNLAIVPEYRLKGYGRAFLEFVENTYKDRAAEFMLCTGLSDATVPFYERCGYAITDVVRGYFTANYDHPIYENGILLTDMAVMKKMRNS